MTAGPNLRGPIFDQFLYEAPVSEGAAKFSSVVTAQARDPEGGPVRYAIVGGNDDAHFAIEESTGVIRVMNPLDREENRRYSLVNTILISSVFSGQKSKSPLLLSLLQTVRAEDTGFKFTTSTVNIFVTDVNDENPHFLDTPYSFRVKEGEIGAPVGKVRAMDDDSGSNAEIKYSVSKNQTICLCVCCQGVT